MLSYSLAAPKVTDHSLFLKVMHNNILIVLETLWQQINMKETVNVHNLNGV